MRGLAHNQPGLGSRKDATGAVAFQDYGEIALNQGNEQEAKKQFHAAEQELAKIQSRQNGSGHERGRKKAVRSNFSFFNAEDGTG